MVQSFTLIQALYSIEVTSKSCVLMLSVVCVPVFAKKRQK